MKPELKSLVGELGACLPSGEFGKFLKDYLPRLTRFGPKKNRPEWNFYTPGEHLLCFDCLIPLDQAEQMVETLVDGCRQNRVRVVKVVTDAWLKLKGTRKRINNHRLNKAIVVFESLKD